jgi:glycosyltransferase involved in cell wall biosynthesis
MAIQSMERTVRLKILLSAYACEPGKGSEPGVGWNFARHLADHHEVWVLTRANNRQTIERELALYPIPSLNFVYHDLPDWACRLKRGQIGIQAYYYLWQLSAVPFVRQIHKERLFDLVHHVTFGKYWAPSALSFLSNVPFVWGPIGGGDVTPLELWKTLSLKGKLYETLRLLAKFIAEKDPFVRHSMRKAKITLAATKQTKKRLYELGVQNLVLFHQGAISREYLEKISTYLKNNQIINENIINSKIIFISVARPLDWKGLHVAMRAFAKLNIKNAEYWIVSPYQERKWLELLALKLGLSSKVRFYGDFQSQQDVHKLMSRATVMVHPAFHESFGMVVLEAMALGLPVLCLELGGPNILVTKETGIKIPVHFANQVICDLEEAMHYLALNPNLARQMGIAGQKRAHEFFTYETSVKELLKIYKSIVYKN